MTMTDIRPRLQTSAGAAVAQPSSPAQWHGRPYVWAWYACSGSLETSYIEARCKEAQEEDTPEDAVYKTGPNNAITPNEWITLGQLSERYVGEVRAYGQALIDWEGELRAQREQRPVVRPVAGVQPPAGEAVPCTGRGVRVVARKAQR